MVERTAWSKGMRSRGDCLSTAIDSKTVKTRWNHVYEETEQTGRD